MDQCVVMTCRDRDSGFRVFDRVAPNLSKTGWDLWYISGREFKVYTREMSPDLFQVESSRYTRER